MAYLIQNFSKGTGDDTHYQFLAAIKVLAESVGWATQRYVNTGTDWEWIGKSAGFSGTEEIYLGIKTYQNSTSGYYNFNCAVFTGFYALNDFEAQPGYKNSGVPLYNDNLTAYVQINQQRIVFVCKVVSSIFVHCYIGKFFPYASPTEYPYPVCVAGMFYNGAETRLYSDINMNMPYKGDAVSIYANQDAAFFIRDAGGVYDKKFAYPFSTGNVISRGLYNTGTGPTNLLIYPLNGQYAIEPIIPQTYDESVNPTVPGMSYGELDGVYAITGFGNSSENVLQIGGSSTIDQTGLTPSQAVSQILAVGGRAFVIAQNANKTTANDYIALELK